MKKLRAIIIDNELDAIDNVVSELEKFDKYLEVVGVGNNTSSAATLIKTYKPNVVFMDIRMPEESGIDFIARQANRDYEVVFITAYNEYAVKAFELNAVDYILKPIQSEYVEKTIQRLLYIAPIKEDVRYESLLKQSNIQIQDYILIRNNHEIITLYFKNILYLKSVDGYTEFHNKQTPSQLISSYHLSHYEEVLPSQFVRVHKSYIVNWDKRKSIVQKENQYFIGIKDVEELIPFSRRKMSEMNLRKQINRFGK